MFKLFGRKKRNSIAVGLWQKIGVAIDARAKLCANWLNNKTEKISHRTMTYLLVLLCIYWGAGCMYIILEAIHKKKNPFSVTSISVPKHINTGSAIEDTSLQNAVVRIEHFKAWLDSLHTNHDPRYDNIVRGRPGLLDSIGFIEKYYSSKK